LIFGKIITIAATRGQILRLKCTKFYFGWEKGRGGERREREWRGGKGRLGNVEFHHLLLSNLTTDFTVSAN